MPAHTLNKHVLNTYVIKPYRASNKILHRTVIDRDYVVEQDSIGFLLNNLFVIFLTYLTF